MKSLSLSRPLVIMMLGIPGAGKSFFAKQFSDMFQAPLVSYDELRHTLFAEQQFTREEEAIVDALAAQQIRELLKTRATFIVDGGMSTITARSNLNQLARRKDFDTLTIWVQVDEPSAKARALKRSPRRSGDQFNPSLPVQIFERETKRVSPPSTREPYIVISGKHTFASQAKVVLRHITEPRESQSLADTAKRESLTAKRPAAKAETPRRRGITIS